MTQRGHNERSFRLDELAAAAREGLKRVDQGEHETLLGWIDFGIALNEGRALFPGDREFGEWVALLQLVTAESGEEINRNDRAAAMWAAANADQLAEAQEASKARTIRGLHEAWKKIEAERERAEVLKSAERQTKAEPTPDPAPQGAALPASSGRQEGDGTAPPAEKPAAGNTAASGRRDEGASPPPDPYGYADLTEEALLDLANGLRIRLDEEQAARKRAEAEVEKLRRQVEEMIDATDSATVIRNQAKEIKRLNDKVWKANEDARRAIGARRRAEDRVKALEGAEITL